MRTIAIINQKGGVGKSTTALSVGAGFGYRGHNVLFIDLDPQGNLSHTVGASGAHPGSIDLLSGKVTAEASIQRAQWDIIASSPLLTGADAVITSTGKEYRLREALEPILDRYDNIVIDTPPTLGILTVNALTACEGCVIPAQADIYSLQAISQLYGTIQTVQKYCNQDLKILGILLTRHNNRAIISREVADMMAETASAMDTKLFSAKIRECTAIKESQAVKQNILAYAPKSNASVDYNKLIDELMKEE